MFRSPVECQVHVNGQKLAVFEWPGPGPTVLLCHATGFHARCWDRVIAEMPARHCVAFDFRGHGRSSKPAPPYCSWRAFGEDVAALSSELGIRNAVGVGHSMGGHAASLAAALNPGAFSRLVLIDPVIRSKGTYLGPWVEARYVAKRRNRWASAQEMYDRFRGRPPFVFWNPDVLHDYCEYGLTPDGSGGFALACPPEIEASIYEHSSVPESDIYPEIESIDVRVRVVRSGKESGDSFNRSPTAPGLAAHFRHGTDLKLSGHSHFIPMEAPGLTAEIVSAL